MTVYRVEVVGPEPRTADDIALMLTSDDHYRTSDYVITVMTEELPCGYCCTMCDQYDDPDHSCELCTQPLAEPHESCLAGVAAYLEDVAERKARGEM